MSWGEETQTANCLTANFLIAILVHAKNTLPSGVSADRQTSHTAQPMHPSQGWAVIEYIKCRLLQYTYIYVYLVRDEVWAFCQQFKYIYVLTIKPFNT